MKKIIYKYSFIAFISFWMQHTKAQDPNWSVNAASYQYSMTFTAFLNVDGTTLTASNDKVAAFVGGEIRGVANVVYVSSANKYVAYLSVYANTNNETIRFKIYNSSTNSTVNIDKTETFGIDEHKGGVFSLIVLQVQHWEIVQHLILLYLQEYRLHQKKFLLIK